MSPSRPQPTMNAPPERSSRRHPLGRWLLGAAFACLIPATPADAEEPPSIEEVGGTEFTFRLQPNADPESGETIPLLDRDVRQAMRILRRRLEVLGTSTMALKRVGEDSVRLRLPGVGSETAADIKEPLQKVAKIEFRAVNLRGGSSTGPNGESLARMVFEDEEVVPGHEAYKYVTGRDGETFTEYLLLENRPVVDSGDLAEAYPQSTVGSHQVGIELTEKGGQKMRNYTKGLITGRDRMAILVDGEVITAPPFTEVPIGASLVIEGQESFEEASILASQLNTPLKNKIILEKERTISPDLVPE